MNFINNITLSNQTLQYPAVGIPTPEEEALAWLIEEDPAQLNVSMGAERIRQRYALLTLWFHQPSSTQIKLIDWLSIDECKWELGADPCTASGVVDGIDLRRDNLQGRIPDDPAHLSVSMGAERIRQRYALLTLWFRQPTSTQTKLADWLSIDECNWEGPAPCTTRPVWWLPLICVAAISRVAFRMTLVS